MNALAAGAARWPQLPVVAALAFAAAPRRTPRQPPVLDREATQMFTLAVPTEKESATTTQIELTSPAGFAIDSFEAAPGWTRTVSDRLGRGRRRSRR